VTAGRPLRDCWTTAGRLLDDCWTTVIDLEEEAAAAAGKWEQVRHLPRGALAAARRMARKRPALEVR
jgi:hypothetical protein